MLLASFASFGLVPFLIIAGLCLGMFWLAYTPAIQDSLERDARARERRAEVAAAATKPPEGGERPAPPATPPGERSA